MSLPSIEQAIALYKEEYIASRNLAPLTRLAYVRDLGELAIFLQERRRVGRVDRVKWQHLEAFLGHLDSQGLSGNYRRRKVAAIRSFFGFLEERGLIPGNPARKLIPPEREDLKPRFLTAREYKQLLAAVRHKPRDAAIVELLLQTGMRLSELSRLKLTDVELPATVSKDLRSLG